MMNFLSRLRRETNYQSLAWHESDSFPGVRFAVRKVSLRQRLELTRQIRELTLKHEFLKAGDTPDQLEATIADLLVRKLYVEWGLQEVTGLRIDGQPADTRNLVEKGPEPLIEEVFAALRGQLELSDGEIKNS